MYKKTNPIQTQYKPNQTQLKPIKCQNKPNTKPIKANFKGKKMVIDKCIKIWDNLLAVMKIEILFLIMEMY